MTKYECSDKTCGAGCKVEIDVGEIGTIPCFLDDGCEVDFVQSSPNAQPSEPIEQGSQQSKGDCNHEQAEYLSGNIIVGMNHRSTIVIDGVPMPIQRWCPDCGAIQIDTIKRDIRKSYPLGHGYKWILPTNTQPSEPEGA